MNKLEKKAFKSTPFTDAALGLVPGSVPVIGPIASRLGLVTGLMEDPSDEQTDGIKSLIPGVASHRMANRIKSQVLLQRDRYGVEHGGKNSISEVLGPLTTPLSSLLAGAGIGAGVGALTGKNSKKDKKARIRRAVGGAIIGGGAGVGTALVGEIVAAVRALAKKRRTAEEQADHDSENHIAANLLLPGYGSYNSYKRIGRSQGDRDEREERESRSGKTKKAEYIRGVLSKTAAPLPGTKMLGRYWELLKGGKKSVLSARNRFENNLMSIREKAIRRGDNNASRKIDKMLSDLANAGAGSKFSIRAKGYKNPVLKHKVTQNELNELDKVWGARIGTGAAAATGAAGLAYGMNRGENEV